MKKYEVISTAHTADKNATTNTEQGVNDYGTFDFNATIYSIKLNIFHRNGTFSNVEHSLKFIYINKDGIFVSGLK